MMLNTQSDALSCRNCDPVTTRPQLRALAVAWLCAVTVANIVSYGGLRTTPRLRQLIGVALVSWMLIVVVTECGIPCLDTSAPTGSHTHAASLVHQFADVADHPHAADASTVHTHLKITAAALPRATTLAAALGLAVAMILALGWWGAGVGISMRGPPRRAPTVVSGRAILTRFCVIRC